MLKYNNNTNSKLYTLYYICNEIQIGQKKTKPLSAVSMQINHNPVSGVETCSLFLLLSKETHISFENVLVWPIDVSFCCCRRLKSAHDDFN